MIKKLSETKTIYKNWGKEVILNWPLTDVNTRYAYKRIYINAGHKTSLQKHEFKSETNYLISGKAKVILEDDNGQLNEFEMGPDEFFSVPAGKIHRVIAITDIVLQECSTPEVDDCIRLQDDYGRKDGRIDSEHKKPAFLILAAGSGNRVNSITKGLHKGLLKYKDKAIISHLIDKVPTDYDIIIATGYNSELIFSYCYVAHPERKIQFIQVPDWETGGPGASAAACKQDLDRPFYCCTVDCLFDGPLPGMEEDWAGFSKTDLPQVYSTAKLDGNDYIIDFKNKDKDGYENAFIGLMFVSNYRAFWENLGDSKELINAFNFDKQKYKIKARFINWTDTGNVDSYLKLVNYKLPEKNTEEENYLINNKFIKINSNLSISQSKKLRYNNLEDYSPDNVGGIGNVLSYDFIKGNTLYELDSFYTYENFIDIYLNKISNTPFTERGHQNEWQSFYVGKTLSRLAKFGAEAKVDLSKLDYNKSLYSKFWHGDLQPDNIIDANSKFVFIDIRDSFSGLVEGDLYYDLAKFYGGLEFNYLAAKDSKNLSFIDKDNYSVPQTESMKRALAYYREALAKVRINKLIKINVNYVEFLSGLIKINMAPLHKSPMKEICYYEGLRIMNKYAN